MKRHLIITAITCLAGLFIISSTAYSQDEDNKIHLGFKVGANYSLFTKPVGPFDKNSPGYTTGPFSNSNNMGFLSANIGITADYKLNNNLTLATELLLNGHGMEYDMKHDGVVLTDTAGNQSDAHDTYDYEIYYLELPIILRYNLPINAGNTAFAVYAGLSPGIKLAANTIYDHYTVDGNNNVNEVNEKQNLSNVRNFQLNTIAGFWIGAKQSTPDLPVSLFFDIRFEYSYLPVFDIAQRNGGNYYTNMFNMDIGVGVRF